MRSSLSGLNSRGSVIIYTLFLTIFAVTAAYLLVIKSETLFVNLENSRTAAKLDKNLTAAADLAIKYAASLNRDWGGFTNTLRCPSDFTLTNTSSGIVVYSGVASPTLNNNWAVSCSGTAGGGLGIFTIKYTITGTGFESADFLGINHLLTSAGLLMQGPVFTGSGGFQYRVSFTTPTTFSGIDLDGNSDDRLATSTGTIAYPGGYTDNDALGRQISYGYIRRTTGLSSILWSNTRTNDYIRAVTTNSGATVPSAVSSGALYLTIDSPYTLRIEEYDRAQYLATREFKVLTWSTITSWSGGVGYLQSNLSLTGEYGATGALAGARLFDFANRDYALFLSFSGSTIDPNADFLRYQIKASTSTGWVLNIVPLNDDNATVYRFLAGTIVPTANGERFAKMTEITRGTE